MPQRRWVGSIELVVVKDGDLKIGPDRLFKDVDPAEYAPLLEGLERDADGQFDVPMASLLIRSQGKNVLIDTGIGARNYSLARGGGKLLGELAAVGVQPEDIDHVIMSHAHGDHIGWNTVDDAEGAPRPTFPKARYWMQRAEWEHFTEPHRLEGMPITQHNLPPLMAAGVLELVDGERDVTPEVRIIPTPGHTPGHSSIVIASPTETAVFTGDISHHPLHYEKPEWRSMFDVLPAMAKDTALALLRRAVQERLLLVSYHHPTAFGHAVPHNSAFRWVPEKPA